MNDQTKGEGEGKKPSKCKIKAKKRLRKAQTETISQQSIPENTKTVSQTTKENVTPGAQLDA